MAARYKHKPRRRRREPPRQTPVPIGTHRGVLPKAEMDDIEQRFAKMKAFNRTLEMKAKQQKP